MKIKINNNVGVMSDPSFKLKKNKIEIWKKNALSLLSNFTNKTR